MNLIGVDVSLTGWYVLQVLERGDCQLFFFFFSGNHDFDFGVYNGDKPSITEVNETRP